MQKITKKDVEEFEKAGGQTRGMMLKSLEPYLVKKKGAKYLEAIEKRVTELGYPFEFKNVSAFKWYPAPFVFTALMVVFESFNWDKKEVFNIGYEAPINSLFSKLILRAFTSLETAYTATPKFWKSYTTSGDMEWTERNMEKKHAVLKLSNHEDFKYPIIYDYMMGYLKRLMEITAKSKNVTIELTKSMQNGDPYDEFTFNW